METILYEDNFDSLSTVSFYEVGIMQKTKGDLFTYNQTQA